MSHGDIRPETMSAFDQAALRVLAKSREDADARALAIAGHERSMDEYREREASYKSIASREARKLGRLMVNQRRMRLVPGSDTVPMTRRRIDGEDESWQSGLNKGKTITLTTPLMFTHDALTVATETSGNISVPLQSGWRFVARVTGSYLHEFFARMTPSTESYIPELTDLRAQQVIVNCDDPSHTEVVADYEYRISEYRQGGPRPELDENDAFFQNQAGYLMAAQKILRGIDTLG
jgi:hypothetical protein